MGDDSRVPPPPRGIFAAGLTMLAAAVVGAVVAAPNGSVLYLILGIVRCVCGLLLGAVFRCAGFKGRRANR